MAVLYVCRLTVLKSNRYDIFIIVMLRELSG